MNQNQRLFLRISYNGAVSNQLEVLTWRAALEQIHLGFTEHNGRKVLMNVEISNQPFPMGNSTLSREQQLEQSMMSQSMENLDEVIYPPDVTLREVNEAFGSPEGELMFRYQRADNRIGVDPALLQKIQSDYLTRFPRVAPHAPLWPTH